MSARKAGPSDSKLRQMRYALHVGLFSYKASGQDLAIPTASALHQPSFLNSTSSLAWTMGLEGQNITRETIEELVQEALADELVIFE